MSTICGRAAVDQLRPSISCIRLRHADSEPIVMESKKRKTPRIALIHDWFMHVDGSIRVLAELMRCFPDADLFALIDFLPSKKREKNYAFRLQKLLPSKHASCATDACSVYYVPLMPIAIEQFDLAAYDILISSSSTAAKGIIVHPHQVHISYIHSPMRFAWDLEQYYLQRFGWDRGLKGVLRIDLSLSAPLG